MKMTQKKFYQIYCYTNIVTFLVFIAMTVQTKSLAFPSSSWWFIPAIIIFQGFWFYLHYKFQNGFKYHKAFSIFKFVLGLFFLIPFVGMYASMVFPVGFFFNIQILIGTELPPGVVFLSPLFAGIIQLYAAFLKD